MNEEDKIRLKLTRRLLLKGQPNNLLEAIEKQSSKSLVYSDEMLGDKKTVIKMPHCPSCNKWFPLGATQNKYCYRCGQKLDWRYKGE